MSESDRPALEHVTDHAARGLARLTSRFRTPAVEAILSSHLVELQEVEDALWSILLLTLDTAEDAQLDQIAALLGEPRADLDDDTLRTVLRARVLANRSDGVVDELHAILSVFVDPSNVAVDEYFPAGLLASFVEFADVPMDRIGALLRRATAGGVGVQLVAPTRAVGAFRFSITNKPMTSTKGFSDTTQAAGGHLAGAY